MKMTELTKLTKLTKMTEMTKMTKVDCNQLIDSRTAERHARGQF